MVYKGGMGQKMIIISPLDAAEGALARHPRAHVCGLLGPEMPHPALPVAEACRLRLNFHDVAAPAAGLKAARPEDAAAIITFARRWRGDDTSGVLMFHCWAGISRSTAAAFMVRCALEPERDEAAIARELRDLAPWATPNPLLVSLADDLLGRNGRMRAAIAAIGRGRDAFQGEVTKWAL